MIENIEALKPDGYNVSNRKKKKKTIVKLPFIIKDISTIFSKIPVKIKKENIILKHYGINNQNWGDRNGPPYPLPAEVHNAVVSGINGAGKMYLSGKLNREKKIKLSNDPNIISKNLGLFTTQELQDKINRIEKENRIRELAQTKKQQKNGETFIIGIGKSAKKEFEKDLGKKIGKKISNSMFGNDNSNNKEDDD